MPLINRMSKPNQDRQELVLNPWILGREATMRMIDKIPLIPSSRRYYMVINKEKRFIWFKVPRVATRATVIHLRKLGVMPGKERYHSSHYPVRLYHDYIKFAIVRNPWDRLVSSWYKYKKLIAADLEGRIPRDMFPSVPHFPDFVEYVSTLNMQTCDPHLRLQSALIDLNHIDYLGRHETMDHDLPAIMKKIGLPDDPIEKTNVSPGRKHYSEYYDDRLKNKTFQIYRNDVRIFGYDF